MVEIDINNLDVYFQKGELIPAIAFDVDTKTVLMLAYMNKESLRKTLETGYTWYWSRSRQELWNKGATSGHLQKVVSIYSDCDNDTLVWHVTPDLTAAFLIKCIRRTRQNERIGRTV